MPGSRRGGKPGKRVASKKQANSKKKTAGRTLTKSHPKKRDLREISSRARSIAGLLGSTYPDAHCMLDHSGPFELLVATILAAQCTDERVNKVTPALFKRFPTPAAMAAADIDELEGLIRSTGFYHNKAKSIKSASEVLCSKFAGGFPGTMDGLVALPGVGRKTANVVLGTCFGTPAIIVDTHFRRVTQRLGLVVSDNPDEIEREMTALLPPEEWTRFSHSVTFHGRRCCAARKPDHAGCPVSDLCDSRDI
jgi:endonuclease III